MATIKSGRAARAERWRSAAWVVGSGVLGGAAGVTLGAWLDRRRAAAAAEPSPPWERTLRRRIDALALTLGYGLGLYRLRRELAATWRQHWPPAHRRTPAAS